MQIPEERAEVAEGQCTFSVLQGAAMKEADAEEAMEATGYLSML